MRLLILVFLKDKWVKEKCVMPSILILFLILKTFKLKATILLKE
jgi:hypothetical protein